MLKLFPHISFFFFFFWCVLAIFTDYVIQRFVVFSGLPAFVCNAATVLLLAIFIHRLVHEIFINVVVLLGFFLNKNRLVRFSAYYVKRKKF